METNKKNKKAKAKKKGGTRPGAGRKSIYSKKMVRVTIRIPEYQLDHVLSKGKASPVLRDLIEEDITNERES